MKSPGEKPENPKKQVALIIETDALQRDLMRLTLENLGCEVLITTDGGKARRWLRQRQPSLLVIDTFVPNVNGLDLLKSYQTAHLLDATRVIMVSALGFEEVVRQALQLGVAAYLVKPLDMELFSARARALLG